MAALLESLGTLLSPLGTNVGLKTMIERCLSARTKTEERWLFHDSLKLVQLKLKEASTRLHVVAKCLLFASLAEMLGYKAEFAYIHALKLAQQGSLTEKKIGYLACSALLRTSDPLSILLVNTILRDLASRNLFEVAMAITASCQFFPDDQLPTLMPLLVEKLHHTNEYVRCKAVIAMHHFSRRSPQHCSHYASNVVALLSDKDPGVVTHVVHFLADNQCCLPSSELLPALINIQRQILANKLPRDYTYHSVSAPWMQVVLIRLLGTTLTPAAQEVITDTLTACSDVSQLMTCAIACECAAALVRHNNAAQDSALKLAAKLVVDNNSNIKLAGLQLFQRLAATIDGSLLAVLHRPDSILLPTLQHRDRTLRNATLCLLCATSTAAHARNVCSLVANAVDQSRSDNADQSQATLNKELVHMAVELAAKYPDDRSYWHLAMMIRLLPMTEDDLTVKVHARIKMALTADESEHLLLARSKVLRVLREYCASKEASTSLLKMYVWALSRFSPSQTAVPSIAHIGLKVLRNAKQGKGSNELLISIVDAANYAVTRGDHGLEVDDSLLVLIQELKQSALHVGYLRDATLELSNTVKHLSLVQQVLPTKEDEFDFTLSFLDDFVINSLESGGGVYEPVSQSESGVNSTDLAASESESRSWDDFDVLSSLDSWNPFRSQRSPVWTPSGRIEVETTNYNAAEDTTTPQLTKHIFAQDDLGTEVDEFDQITQHIVQSKR